MTISCNKELRKQNEVWHQVKYVAPHGPEKCLKHDWPKNLCFDVSNVMVTFIVESKNDFARYHGT